MRKQIAIDVVETAMYKIRFSDDAVWPRRKFWVAELAYAKGRESKLMKMMPALFKGLDKGLSSKRLPVVRKSLSQLAAKDGYVVLYDEESQESGALTFYLTEDPRGEYSPLLGRNEVEGSIYLSAYGRR